MPRGKSNPLVLIDRKILRIQKQLAEAQAERGRIFSHTVVMCCNTHASNFNSPVVQPCGRFLEIGTLTFIRPLHYTRPYGCNEGDYWSWDEKDAFFDCPCGYRNRLYTRPEIIKLKDFFKDSRDWEMR